VFHSISGRTRTPWDTGKFKRRIHSECPQQVRKASIQTTVVNIEECLKGTGDPIRISTKNRQLIANMYTSPETCAQCTPPPPLDCTPWGSQVRNNAAHMKVSKFGLQKMAID